VQLTTFLRDTLKLELSEEKTLITHAATHAARFLGYAIRTQRSKTRRTVNGRIALLIPPDVIRERRRRYTWKGKPMHRNEALESSDFEIVTAYQSEYRGLVEFYALAQNLFWLNDVRYTMETSLLKTLARKHKSTVNAMAAKYGTTVPTPSGPRRCLQVIVTREGKRPLTARFGGISLERRGSKATIVDRPERPFFRSRTELVDRLLAETCEVCGSRMNVEVHHIRKLSDLKRRGRKEKPIWMRMMIARARKTLVLCRRCHHDLHAGRPLVVEGTE
jgi:hypothetical protein